MKSFLSFLQLPAMDGFLTLLLMKIVQLIIGPVTPIAGSFPDGTFDVPEHPVALAMLLILGASMRIGSCLNPKTAIRLGRWIEEKTVARLAFYRFVNALRPGRVGVDRSATFNNGHVRRR